MKKKIGGVLALYAILPAAGEMGGGEASWLPVKRMGIRGHGQADSPCGQEP